MKSFYSNHNKVKSTILLSIMVLSFRLVNAQSSTIQTDVPALKEVYAGDFYLGCLLSYAHIGFANDPYVPGQSDVVDPNGGYLIKYHMNSMSPGNWMKSVNIVDISGSATAYNNASTQFEKDSIDVHPRVKFNGNIIAQLNWAKRQGFTFRGHTLVWHNQHPGTAFFRTGYNSNGERLSKEKMTERMDNYIKEVIRIIHEGWPGLLSAMDVVNEAVKDDGTDRTESEWYITFGDSSYIMKAFEFTRKWTEYYGETQMKLYYNDYNTHIPAKADGIVRICKPIYEAGYLDGIGMQDHDQYNSPTAEQWITSYEKFEPICDEISVTELDVKPSTDSATRWATQANQYAALIKCFVERSYFSGRGKIISVSKDGLNDKWAFVTNASLWDAQNQCKPAFYEVVKVGINYNALDSLISITDTLSENKYTIESWELLMTSLSKAQYAMNRNYSYTVSAGDSLENAKNNLDLAIRSLVVSSNNVNEYEIPIPEQFILSQNYPNPFNPTTTIGYQLPISGYSTLKVYNLLGQEVATIFEGIQSAGNYSVTFDASGLTGGIYLYQLKAGNFVENKKFILLK
ncbi:MAG TPA: endo-1,4-beta-xylanase [Candidatus Marinimicrobia bacterium]|nr:endo-1,4-beta-xylanase [Candidatus Neomarinimicrobiota bacterium]